MLLQAFKHAQQRMAAPLALCVTLVLGLGMAPAAHAALAEAEPNDSCATAQDLGSLSKGTVKGELPALGDIDFFRFTATPGSTLQLDLKGLDSSSGTLEDPLLGIYDSSCTLTAANDDSGVGRDAQWLYRVPADGVVIVAATGTGDFSYTGTSTYTGSYQFKFGKPSNVVYGAVSDAATQQPVAPDSWVYVNLNSCEPGYDICRGNVAQTTVDEDGNFYISMLERAAGVYQLQAFGNGYADYYSAPFTVDGSSSVKKNIKLKLTPILMTDFQVCTPIIPGQVCKLRYTATNQTSASISADVWASVTSYPTGGEINTVQYSTGKNASHKPQTITIPAQGSIVVTQPLTLPATTPSGAAGDIGFFATKPGKPGNVLGHGNAFNYSVGSAGGATRLTAAKPAAASLRRQNLPAPASAKGKRLQADDYPASRGKTVTGTVLLDDTGLPPTAGDSGSALLFQCSGSDDQLCGAYLGFLPLDENGRYLLRSKTLSGRYQMWADVPGYAQGYSEPFNLVEGGTGYTGVDFRLKRPTAPITDLVACDGSTQIPKGSSCTARYKVTNTTLETQTIDVWAQILSTTTGTAINTVNYDIGADGSRVPMQITLAPGEVRDIEQAINWPELAQSGTNATASFYTSLAGQPHAVTGYLYGFTVFVTPEGSATLSTAAPQ
jgi:hypothetical protein